jgi:hypothetical protein
MRILSTLAVLALGASLAACTYVERTPPTPTVVQTPPTVVAPAPAPTVTVRPAY